MFSIRLFGYDREEVELKLNELQAQLEELTAAYEGSVQQTRELQAQVEDFSIRLASARRDLYAGFIEKYSATCKCHYSRRSSIDFCRTGSLADRMDKSPQLSVEFRMFRDGFYRVDAWVESMPALKAWLETQPEVREVRFEEHTLHILLKEVVQS